MTTVTILSWLFFLSGAAGLIYESMWARYLGLFVGHDAYGQIAVLVMFLGGMSLGAAAVGRLGARVRSPLLGYAVVELGAGVIGFAFHPVYLRLTGLAYDAIYPALAGSWMLPLAKWAIAGGLILPQSVLLGATFPLMTAGAIRLSRLPEGRLLSQLYFANSLGAALGVLAAGFWLVGRLGLPGTLRTAAILNLLVGAATLGVWAMSRVRTEAAPSVVPIEPGTAGKSGLRGLLLAVTFGTAVASFIYEVGWIRMLALVLGSATHSFELMLSAFILGLALGAVWIRYRADRITDPLRALGTIQWLMGAAAVATLPIYAESFEWMARLISTFARTDGGYIGFTVSRYGICLAVMLPATFLAGMTLPLITRTLMTTGDGERAIGTVYAVNTLGSIIGVVVSGLWLLPSLGLKGTLVAGAVIDMGLGALLLLSAGSASRRLAYALAGGTLLIALAVPQLVDLRKGLLASGVFRGGQLPVPESSVVFYSDGRTATVSAVQAPDASVTFLATNGKADASLAKEWFVPCSNVRSRVPLSSDAATQSLAAIVTLAYAPAARSGAVIGHGSGISSHHLLASPDLKRLYTIEIEPRMIEGSRVFYPNNRRVFDDPRSTLVTDDAKSYFAAEQQTYDLILSEPSNPWVSGVSGLFSTEFYTHIVRHLSEDGVFTQWLHLYESDDDLALRVLAAIHRSFRSYEIFFTTESDIVIVASKRDRLPAPDWSVLAWPAIEQDLCRFVPLHPEALEASRLGGRALFQPLLDSLVQPNSDFYPALDLGAEKARFLGGAATGLQALGRDRFSLASLLQQRLTPLPRDARLPVATIPRVLANSVTAQVRAYRANVKFDRSEAADASDAILQWRLWQGALDDTRPPFAWLPWLREFEEAERILSGGAQGAADEEFYRAVNQYLDRVDAPPPVRQVVSFYHGLAAWDFPQAAYAAQRLLPEFQRGHDWITSDDLRDGAVVARLKIGDLAGARRVYEVLAPRSLRPQQSFQTRLLEAHLRQAEAGRSRDK
jgi:spermidine synthase